MSEGIVADNHAVGKRGGGFCTKTTSSRPPLVRGLDEDLRDSLGHGPGWGTAQIVGDATHVDWCSRSWLGSDLPQLLEEVLDEDGVVGRSVGIVESPSDRFLDAVEAFERTGNEEHGGGSKTGGCRHDQPTQLQPLRSLRAAWYLPSASTHASRTSIASALARSMLGGHLVG